MSCNRCKERGQPPEYASPVKCAFPNHGTFNPDNWGCALIEALSEAAGPYRMYGQDESLDVILCDPNRDNGFIVLSRYKRRGRVSNAVWVGDFSPAREVTADLCERALVYLQRRDG